VAGEGDMVVSFSPVGVQSLAAAAARGRHGIPAASALIARDPQPEARQTLVVRFGDREQLCQ